MINKPPLLRLKRSEDVRMSLDDISQALALAEKGYLSPDSFRKVVSRVVREEEGEKPCKSEEKVCLVWVYRL